MRRRIHYPEVIGGRSGNAIDRPSRGPLGRVRSWIRAAFALIGAIVGFVLLGPIIFLALGILFVVGCAAGLYFVWRFRRLARRGEASMHQTWIFERVSGRAMGVPPGVEHREEGAKTEEPPAGPEVRQEAERPEA